MMVRHLLFGLVCQMDRSLVVCSGATLQTEAMLPLFRKKRGFLPDNPSKPVILVQSLTILS